MLPNLRRLRAQVETPLGLDLVPAVASSSLLSLELVLVDQFYHRLREGWQPYLEEKLPVILSTTPNLLQFRLDFGRVHLSDKLASSIAQTVVSLRSLDMNIALPISGPTYNFQVMWIDLPLLAPLRQLERLCLHSSCLTLDVRFPLPPSSGAPTAPLFPNLREIDICPGGFAPRFYSWCELLQSSSVQRLTLTSVAYVSVSDLLKLCSVVVRCFPRVSSFSASLFSIAGTPTPESVEITPLRKAVTPLFFLSSLQHVKIDSSGNIPLISLADADLVAISDCWPGLRDLSLKGFNDSRQSDDPGDDTSHLCNISLSALVALATRCNDLERLEIPLLDVHTLRIEPVDTYPSLNHRLQYFRVAGTTGGEYSTAACILDQLFPHVDVMVQLADLGQREAKMCPCLLGQESCMIACEDWMECAQYRLYLGIAVCQDGRGWTQCSELDPYSSAECELHNVAH
ncbi:hypothetical protein FKP32DRAFT_73840 [Trametes sanguinea]|nr:hypothetical protein FKP32DRAFT_73840 [Trametes sanguinea]